MLKSKTITTKEVLQLAQKYQVSIPQLAIRYCLQLDLLPLPKTGNKKHMENNADVDFTISERNMLKLKGVVSDFDYGKDNDTLVFRKVLRK